MEHNNKEILFPENEERMLTATVTITVFTEEAPSGFLQKEVKVNKKKDDTLGEVATSAMRMFNGYFKEQKYSFRLKEQAQYSIIASADNKIQNYSMQNKLEEFDILDFAFNYKVSDFESVGNESTFRCLFCVCF